MFLCRLRHDDIEIANLHIAPRALREKVFERTRQRELVEIRIPPLLKSKLRRVRVARDCAAFGLANRHDYVRAGASSGIIALAPAGETAFRVRSHSFTVRIEVAGSDQNNSACRRHGASLV